MGFALSDMRLTSSAFDQHRPIPTRHAGEGDDVSPAFVWRDAPDGARAFALICHDPDAPLIDAGTYGFVHWVLYNIPGAVNALDEGTGKYTAGVNNFGKTGYGGPMPPVGHGTHHYFFWIMALDEALALPTGLSLWQLLARVEPHVIAMNRLVGTYERQ